MKINLIPVSHQDFTTLEIDTDEFLIGRMEEPFISAPAEITASMSRKHAKIARDQNHFYIIDFGSLNGTKVNGMAVADQAILLNQDDEIEIGGNLLFRTEIINPVMDETVLQENQAHELTLLPVNQESGLDILVVSGFPFLVSKEAGIFTSFQTTHAEEMKRLSRRHAYIAAEQEQYKLSDMDSTNGTFVNNRRMTEPEVVLNNGDIVSFGGDFFSYIVKFQQAEPDLPDSDATVMIAPGTPEHEQLLADKAKTELPASNTGNEMPAPLSAPAPDQSIAPRTMFVHDPSPFLDILCDDDKAHGNDRQSDSGDTPDTEPNIVNPDASFLTRKLIFLRQLAGALQHKQSTASKFSWRSVGIIVLSIAVLSGVAYHYTKDSTAQLQALIKQADFEQAAELSMRMLKDSPNNTSLLNLSSIAILNTLIPPWQTNLESRKFQNNAQLLKDAQNKYASHPDMERALPLLSWINRLYQFMASRDENARVVLFENELQLSELIDTWTLHKKTNEATLAMIARHVPRFENNYQETLSYVRTLESDQDIYLKAVNTLKASLLEKLTDNQIDAMLADVQKFEQKYTAVSGTEELKSDIYRYSEVVQVLASKDIEKVSKMQQQMVFRTPLFKQFAEQTLVKKLPSKAFSEQYHTATAAWQAGDIEKAINTLAALSNETWGAAARHKLERYQFIVTKFNALSSDKESPQAQQKLFAFHALLKVPEDNYFLKAIEGDFQHNKKTATLTIQKHVEDARKNWQRYIDNGGIGGLLRLENKLSSRYRSQAKLLHQAFQNITYAKRLASELHIQDNRQWKQTHDAVFAEMDKQKKWLKDLELILKPSVLKQKLDLLTTDEG